LTAFEAVCINAPALMHDDDDEEMVGEVDVEKMKREWTE
jgi:hypothetical protein